MTAKAILAAMLVLAALGLSATSADEPKSTVQLVSGREFRGTIDPESNANQLVLRSDSNGITLKRSILWERIVGLNVGSSPRDIAKLRTELSGRAVETRQPSLLKKIEIHAWPVVPAVATASDDTSEPPLRVATVAFDPQIANWDGDVETDGVLIDVAPLDLYGNLQPVGGTLEVELFAPQRRTLDLAPQSGGDTFELVERWTRAITPEDYGPRGARLQLPFGAITPELQPNWTASAYGLVHARLSIPGHGVFDSSRDGVRIRPWAPNRDRLEMKTGQRFLNTENMGRRD